MKKLFKKAISLILAFVLLAVSLPSDAFLHIAKAIETETVVTPTLGGNVWDGTVATGFDSGLGTKENPYVIATPQQLAYFAQTVNNGNNYSEEYIELINDIVLNDVSDFENWETAAPANEWVPIGKDLNVSFNGTFSGNGKTISGMYIKYANYRGLFGVVGDGTNGTVTNFKLEKAFALVYGKTGLVVGEFKGEMLSEITTDGRVLSSGTSQIIGGIAGCINSANSSIMNCVNNANIDGYYSAGGIVGYVYSGIVSGCINNGPVKNAKGFSSTGGICGSNIDGKITDCINNADVQSPKDKVGGIAGHNGETITRSANKGNVKGANYVGGITGESTNATITECYNTGNITATTYAGGITGLLGNELATAYNCTNMIKNCYNTGSVTITGNYCGGIAGRAVAYPYNNYVTNTTVTMCYNIGTITAGNYKGGIVGQKLKFNTNLGGSCNVTYCVYLRSCVTSPNNTLFYPATYISDIKSYVSSFGVSSTGAWKISEIINNGELPVLKWQKPDIPVEFTGTATLTGTAKLGSSLSVEISNLWPASEAGYLRYTWYSDGVMLEDAPNRNYYTITVDDLGHKISAVVLSDGDCFGQLNTNEVYVSFDNVVWNGESATRFFSGKGTSSEPYIIKTPYQLKYLSDVVNNGTKDTDEVYFKEKYYRLESDIYLNDLINYNLIDEVPNKNIWTPIGGQKIITLDPQPTTAAEISAYQHNLGFIHAGDNNTFAYYLDRFTSPTCYTRHAFDGHFDGGGHTIQGLYTKYVSSAYQGLFGISSGVVENLTIDNSYVAGSKYVGSVVGYLFSWNGHFGIVRNCTSYADVYGSSSSVGGIVGGARAGQSIACAKENSMNITLENCKNYGNVQGYSLVGGITGEIDREFMCCTNGGAAITVKYPDIYITNCANFGQIGKSTSNRIGGIAGFVDFEFMNFNMYYCYNKGYVFGNEGVGGLLGCVFSFNNIYTSLFGHCYNIGPVNGNNCVGGLIGDTNGFVDGDYGYIYHSYNAGKVTKNSGAGGSITGDLYGERTTYVLKYSDVFWLKTSALYGAPEEESFAYTFGKDGYVTYKQADLLTLLVGDAENSRWIADTNNSNGGFPELEEGEDNTGYYIDFTSNEHDYITPDKTIAAPGETVNFITTQHNEKAPYLFVDGKEINGYSFKTTGEHTVYAEYRERIELPDDIKVTVVPDTYVYDGYYHTPTAVVEGYTQGVDYTLGYSSNRDPGTAYVWIKGCGKYTGNVLVPFTIEKITKTAPTNTPMVISKGTDYVNLEYIEGCEYRINDGDWQSDNHFYNLTPGTEYTFYYRYVEEKYYAASASSPGLNVKTYKNNVSTPSKPTVLSVTATDITLQFIEGYEYKIGNGDWQSSNVFTDLSPETEYIFYQRVAETDISYASSSSVGVTVTTLKAYLLGDINGDDEVDLNDVVALAQHVAGWDVYYLEDALDTNGDNAVNLTDIVHLAQYVAGWEGIILH